MAQNIDVPWYAYILYYIVLFWSYWFGASRFDYDGDGDFDPEDVAAYLGDRKFINKNFKQTQTKRRRLAKAKAGDGAAGNAAPAQQLGVPSSTRADADPSFFDRNGDGVVDAKDIFESKVNGPAAEEIVLENLLEGQVVPWFSISMCVVCFGLWFVFSCKQMLDETPNAFTAKRVAGLDSISEGLFTLQLYDDDCVDQRMQAWRWLSYQFSHAGPMHVLTNLFLVVLMGVPLEGLHGCLRMAIMFNAGVLGGAFCYFLLDGHMIVVGCSGGCYALIGVHFADLFLNWNQKKFRLPTLFFLLSVVTIEILSYYASMSPKNASHAAHIGGAVTGLLIGVLVCRNLKMRAYEKVIWVVCAVLATAMTTFCVVWMIEQEGRFYQNVIEAMSGDEGWCWVRAVWSPNFENTDTYQCVMCSTQECIQTHSSTSLYQEIVKVGVSQCENDSRIGGWLVKER